MERYTISKSEKQTIFEIYRACRLCGAGGGYRMPIIQNIVDLDSSEVELRKKIQECLQLEVRPDDRMPPLICELCVDKLNDFYQFLQLSRQTNIRTRSKLGLPLQSVPKGESKSEPAESILGVTQPVRVEAKKKSKAGPKCSKIIKEEDDDVMEVKVDESPSERGSRETSSRGSRESSVTGRGRRRSPPAPPRRGHSEAPRVTQVTLEEKSEKGITTKRISKKELSDLLQDKVSNMDNSLLVPRSYKRVKDLEPPKPVLVPKRIKLTPKESLKEPIKPTKEVTKAVKEPAKSVKEAAKPVKELAKSVKEIAKPVKEAAKPVKEAAKPVKEAAKSVKDTKSATRSLKEPSKLLKELTKLAKELQKPVEEPTPPLRRKPGPKSKQSKQEAKVLDPVKIPKSKAKILTTPPKEEVTPKPNFDCLICNAHMRSPQGLASHLKSHLPMFTKPQNACNPCGEWFSTPEEATVHHRYHRSHTFPYHCRRCFGDFQELRLYDEHIENNNCAPTQITPDVKCDVCWKEFPTLPLLDSHRCQGKEGRPGGNCPKCQRPYATLRSLKKHESVCKHRRKRNLIADPDVLRRLKPMQVRISRCDDLLNKTDDSYCDVSRVKPSYGLDKLYHYPYLSFSLKSDSPRKLSIHGPTQEFERDSFIHWDSEDSDSDNVIKKVESLSILSIKKLFSGNLLGKVPRKKRKVNHDAFDTTNDFGDISSDINDIISGLADDSNHFPGDLAGRSMNEQLRISLNHIIGVPDSAEFNGVDLENVVSLENEDARNVSAQKSVLENERGVSNEKSDLGNESGTPLCNENDDTNETTTKTDLEEKSKVRNENNTTNEDSKKENGVSYENNDVMNESTAKTDLEEQSRANNDVVNESTAKTDLEEQSRANNDVVNESTAKTDIEEQSRASNDVMNESTAKTDLEQQSRASNENSDDINESSQKSDSEEECRVSNENNDIKDERSEISNLEEDNGVSNVINMDKKNSSENYDMENKNINSIENYKNTSSENNDLENESELTTENNDVQNDFAENDAEIALSDIPNENSNLNNEDDECANNGNSELGVACETNDRLNTSDDSTKLPTDTQDQLDSNVEKAIDEPVENNNSDVELNDPETQIDNSNDYLDTENRREIDENETLCRVDSEANNVVSSDVSIKENSVEHDAEMTIEEPNASVNGINNHEIEMNKDDYLNTNNDCKDVKTEELNSITAHKESPIKHSIENLIGDTDKNPDKYIKEVISSIENIIMKNPRNEEKTIERENGDEEMDDQNLLDALDAQIGEHSNENDKITLEDLLPQEDRSMELDDISEDDYNFDT